MIDLAHFAEVAFSNLQTFLLMFFVPKTQIYYTASFWVVLFLLALFIGCLKQGWTYKVWLGLNIVFNALTHPVVFLTLYASGLFYYFGWFRDMFILSRDTNKTILLMLAYVAASVVVYLVFLGIEFWYLKKLNVVKKWDKFLHMILLAHRGYLFSIILVLLTLYFIDLPFDRGLYYYIAYRALGFLYFIGAVYGFCRVSFTRGKKPFITTLKIAVFELAFIAIAMFGALFQTGKPSYIESFLKAKGVDIKK